MNYDVNYFIDMFSAIPEDQWCIRKLINEVEQKCALGHCLLRHTNYKEWNSILRKDFTSLEAQALVVLFTRNNMNVADVNNGDDIKYPQKTPKQRVLAALSDIKEAQSGKKEKSEEVIRYVAVYVDAPVREITKEIILN